MAAAIRLSQQHSCSFDHLLGDREHARRDGEPERLGSFQVDNQLELGGLNDRHIGRLLAFEDTPYIQPALAVAVRKMWSVAHKATRIDKFLLEINGWHGMARRQCDKLITSIAKERIGTDDESADMLLVQRREGRIDLNFRASGEYDCFDANMARCCLKLLQLILGVGIVWVDKATDDRRLWHQFAQEAQFFGIE